MWKKLLSLLLIVCLLSTLVSCGSYNLIIPVEEVGLEDVILVQVNDSEGNILVLAGRDNGEAVMALGEKDENGMTEKITGVFYTTGNEEGFLVELRNDGLPLSLVDTSGTEIIYSNYTDSTVEISIYDNKDNLIAGPTVVEIDPQKIKEIKELFQLYKSGARGWSEIAEIFKVIGLIVGTFTAAVVFMVGVVPATVAAAGISLLLIVISTITSNDVDDVVSIGWGAVTCLPNLISCIGPASSILGEAIELYSNADEEESNAVDFIHIINVTPDSGLIDGVDTDFTVVVEYDLASSDEGELSIAFNDLLNNEGNPGNHWVLCDARYYINKGSGMHEFNVTRKPKDWGSEGDFDVWACIDEIPEIDNSLLDCDKKILTFY